MNNNANFVPPNLRNSAWGSSKQLFQVLLQDVVEGYQWRIQDFPEGGREPSRGGVNTPNFPENCMKSKEFGRPGGGVRPSRPPLDPPMVMVLVWHGSW